MSEVHHTGETCQDAAAQEFVIPTLLEWRSQGLSSALVTVVSIEGSSPRPLGAQMSVNADGHACGYLSGGCLERAVIDEAVMALAAGENRRVRFGKGSAYADIRLPCGAAIDIYIDQAIDTAVLRKIGKAVTARRRVALSTDLVSGLSDLIADGRNRAVAVLTGERFLRPYLPTLRLVLVGRGPAFMHLARLAHSMGLAMAVAGPDAAQIEALKALGIPSRRLPRANSVPRLPLDAFTAAVLLYHEHEWEEAIWPQLLASDCYYLGAQGSPATHKTRHEDLCKAGFDPVVLGRIHSPAGLYSGGRSAPEIALSILAEIMKKARDKGLLP